MCQRTLPPNDKLPPTCVNSQWCLTDVRGYGWVQLTLYTVVIRILTCVLYLIACYGQQLTILREVEQTENHTTARNSDGSESCIQVWRKNTHLFLIKQESLESFLWVKSKISGGRTNVFLILKGEEAV
jgi:hypothetical protein